jgi:signal transduction histidine kinase
MILPDMVERKRTETDSHESREQLRTLTAALQQLREHEKARIARELRDELGEALAGLMMDLEQIITALPPEFVEPLRHAHGMKALLDRTVVSLRRIAADLRPPMLDDLGLIPTIRWLAGDFSERTGVSIDLDLPGDEFEMQAELSTLLFRVVQESLTSLGRHARARHVAVKLCCSGPQVRLLVQDDGDGIDPARLGTDGMFGLIGMREYAAMLGGELMIDSKPGAGTFVDMIIPGRLAAGRA